MLFLYFRIIMTYVYHDIEAYITAFIVYIKVVSCSSFHDNRRQYRAHARVSMYAVRTTVVIPLPCYSAFAFRRARQARTPSSASLCSAWGGDNFGY